MGSFDCKFPLKAAGKKTTSLILWTLSECAQCLPGTRKEDVHTSCCPFNTGEWNRYSVVGNTVGRQGEKVDIWHHVREVAGEYISCRTEWYYPFSFIWLFLPKAPWNASVCGGKSVLCPLFSWTHSLQQAHGFDHLDTLLTSTIVTQTCLRALDSSPQWPTWFPPPSYVLPHRPLNSTLPNPNSSSHRNPRSPSTPSSWWMEPLSVPTSV